MTTDAAVERARDLFEQRAWGEAYEALRAADAEAQLAADDLERLAVATYLTGHDDDACDTWGRAHRAYLRVDDGLAAVRCAFWLGCVLILSGQLAPAHGWFARTQHLLDKGQRGPVETGYLDIAAGLETLFSGDPVAAHPRLEAAATAGLQPCGTGSRRPRPARVRAGADHDRSARRRRGDARRGDGRGVRRRGFAGRHRVDLLRGHRDLPGVVRPPPGPGVDCGTRRLVRRPARPRPVPGTVPRPPCPADADQRSVGGCPRRGRAGIAASQRAAPSGTRRGALRASRAVPAAGRRPGGRRRLSAGQRRRARRAARARPAAPAPGSRRLGGCGDRAGSGRAPVPRPAGAAARRPRRDSARRRRCRGRPRRGRRARRVDRNSWAPRR